MPALIRSGILSCLILVPGFVMPGCKEPTQINPVPRLATISPDTSERGAPAFTLTLTGERFVRNSAVVWNSRPVPTTFVSSTMLTASIGSGDLLVAEDKQVSVVNEPPGGGVSNALTFRIPCRLAPATAAATQTRARLGAFFFDGWSGSLSNFHFDGLADGSFPEREPLSGWQDGNRCAIEQQIAWARRFGIEFFAFDWYFDATTNDPTDENLNSALEIMRSLPNEGLKYALVYVNQDPFIVPTASDWTAVVEAWVGYMQDSRYMRVSGKPLLIVIDAYRMHSDLGSAAAVRDRFEELRTAARVHGLDGVYIVAGLFIPDGAPAQDGLFPDLSAVMADGYDAVSTYGLALSVPLATRGAAPFQILADTVTWTWTQAAIRSPIAVVPLAMSGADARSRAADHEPGRPVFWFTPDPGEVASSLAEVIDWAEANPRVRPEPAPAPPLVLIQGWNEISNGAYLVPTVGSGTTFGDTIGAMLARPSERHRTVLTLDAGTPSDSPATASGTLSDAQGRPIAGEAVMVEYLPVDGALGDYTILGHSPPDAGMATVGFRANTADLRDLWPAFWLAGAARARVSLYRVTYVQPDDGIQRVPDPDFSLGDQLWKSQGPVSFVPSGRGAGLKVEAIPDPEQKALLDSVSFPVSGDTDFELSFSASVSPGSEAAGYFFIGFEDRPGNFLHIPGESISAIRTETIPFSPRSLPAGVGITLADGRYSVALPLGGAEVVQLTARYAGDAGFWPAYASSTH